jgi:enoyl-CoA hydratase
VAGADIAEMAQYSAADAKSFSKHGNDTFLRLTRFPRPVIAAVNGYALGGGCELAMSFDIILASEKAKFGQPEVGLGITPGFSGTQRLPRRVGVAKAKELLFSGRMITAAEAEKIGLVNAVYPAEELMNATIEMAKSFTKNAPVAIKYVKASVDRGMQMDIDGGIALENELYAMCFATEDCKEGLTAFLEKRPAEFKNK